MRWEEMVKLEPRLMTVIQASSRSEDRSEAAYQCYKREIEGLVGWSAEQPALQDPDAYQIALRQLSHIGGW